MAQAVAALSRGHSLFVGHDGGAGLGDTPAQTYGRADGMRRATGPLPRYVAAHSQASAERLRRLADTDDTLAALLARARAERARGRVATRHTLDAALADAMPATDTPIGRRDAMARMAGRLRAQHGHIVRSRASARVLTERLRHLRYPRRRGYAGTGHAAVVAAIRKALDIKGIHDPAARARWERGMDLVARRESNYDANAVNGWDVNAARGTPSRGAWQFIAPTFAAYHEPGTSHSIHDLVAQACAFINYARGHYGVAADASNLAVRIQQADPRRAPRGY
ncbi:transglycosylase [Mycobacterium palustre]|nr:transglycosylase [Mycobacterium palustre]MCV7103211.1 transglycosylase [Mycobacterium palustre]